MDHCLRLDMSFHHEHGPGTMVERVDGDARLLNNFFTEFGLSLISNLMLITGVLGVITFVDWRIGLAFSLVSGLSLYALSLVRGRATPLWANAQQASAELYGDMQERFGS